MNRILDPLAPLFLVSLACAILVAGCASEKKAPEPPIPATSDSSRSASASRETVASPPPVASIDSSTAVDSTAAIASTASTTAGSVPTVGMGIARADVMNLMTDTKFRREGDIDGQQSYVGESGPATVRLIGPEKNLTRASITSIMELTSDESVRNNGYAFGQFTAIIDPAAGNWLRDNIQSGDYVNGFTLDKAFDGRRAHVDYVPLGSERGRLTLVFEKE